MSYKEINDKLMFKLADMLGIDLHYKDGAIRGFEERKFGIGGLWRVENDVTVVVDESSEKLVTAYSRIRKNLWAYLVITPVCQWVLFFDGAVAKMKVGAEHEHGVGDGNHTLARIKNAVTIAFVMEKGKWQQTDSAALLQGLT